MGIQGLADPQTPLIPAKAGTQAFFVADAVPIRPIPFAENTEKTWVPAFAGMSGIEYGP